eukprot:scaffold13196_cov117-Isochrysis_galbana.AAC.5
MAWLVARRVTRSLGIAPTVCIVRRGRKFALPSACDGRGEEFYPVPETEVSPTADLGHRTPSSE